MLPMDVTSMGISKPTVGQHRADRTTNVVSSVMPPAEIITFLAKHQCPDITDRLELERCGCAPLDAGGFGDVYRGALREVGWVAIKCPRLQIRLDDETGHKILKRAARELYTWSHFDHDNIVKLLGVAQFRDRIAMISPWMDNGTLLQYLKRNPAVDRYKLCFEISQGVAYLHESETIHGDIKSGNVLISGDGVAKLADFGCTELQQTTVDFTTTTSGSDLSMRWAAPEILAESVTRSKAADVYALGMTLLEAITGLVPFCGMKERGVYIAVVEKKRVPERPKEFYSFANNEADRLWDLMVSAWACNPSDRPDSASIRARLKSMRPSATPSRSSVSYSRTGRRISRGSYSSTKSQSNRSETIANDARPSTKRETPARWQPPIQPALLSSVAKMFHQRMPPSERIKDELTYPSSFDGRKAIDLIAHIIKTSDRKLALKLGRALDAQEFFHDVTYDRSLRDSSAEIYQFSRPWMSEDAESGYRTRSVQPNLFLAGSDSSFSSINTAIDPAAGRATDTLPSGVFTLLTECYSPTCSYGQPCYAITCPRRSEQQRRVGTRYHITNNTQFNISSAMTSGS